MRVKGIFKPGDFPANADGTPNQEVADLFAYLAPGNPDPEIDTGHSGMAFAALNPTMALKLGQLSKFLALDTSWCQRADLRELALATINLHFKSDFSFQARLNAAKASGISAELLAALPYWRTTGLFTDEQRLVIEYTNAVVRGDVPAELFQRVVDAFGEKGTAEFTTVIGFWSCWAMIINAAQPSF